MRIGLVGVGHLGKIHLRCLLKTKFIVEGFFDTNQEVSDQIATEYNVKAFRDFDSMLDTVDCIDIVSPTVFHFEIAKKAIIKGKHIFIEKPLTETTEQARELVSLAIKYNVIVQVGHVERYNPAIRSMSGVKFNPKFIEGHRLAMFNPRGTDVSVVLDLMIHDLDIILSLIKSEVKNVSANGVCIVSNTPDICNARIEFVNGSVANLTASRISLKNMRKIRIFQDDAYISLDFLDKDAQVIKIENHIEGDNFSGMTMHTNTGLKRIIVETPTIMQNNAIEDELNDFFEAVSGNSSVTVTIQDGYRALHLAQLIQEKIDEA
ncbi:MAG TPA: Gfo/Idh/MocA family oxidoreductase [Saprospiraceae bacterium]|nr:Gfo/Idh/MocA family oxidoreductase [Saprospiraceae bacterium]